MSLAALQRTLQSEPSTLGQLEQALGFSLRRNPQTEDAWLLRRSDPEPGISFVYAAFAGYDLRSEPDPRLDELRLAPIGHDVQALANGVLGLGQVSPEDPGAIAWPRAHGTFSMSDSSTWLFWKRHEPPFHPTRTPQEETDFLRRVAFLVGAPIDEGRIRYAYGPPMISGRHSHRFVRDHTWRLAIKPIEGPPISLAFELSPPIAAETVIGRLGLPPALVSTAGVHQATARLVDAATRQMFVVHGSRIDFGVSSVEGLARSGVAIPAQRAYEPAGASIDRIEIALPH